MRAANEARKSAALLGLAFDNDDGQTRLTRGKNFLLLGGSQESHAVMQETAIKINERLDKRGKRLEDVSAAEIRDICREVIESYDVFSRRGGHSVCREQCRRIACRNAARRCSPREIAIRILSGPASTRTNVEIVADFARSGAILKAASYWAIASSNRPRLANALPRLEWAST